MHLVPIKDFFHINMHVIKKKEIVDHKVFKLQRFSKVFPNVGGNSTLPMNLKSVVRHRFAPDWVRKLVQKLSTDGVVVAVPHRQLAV